MACILQNVIDTTVDKFNLIHEFDNAFNAIESKGFMVSQFQVNESTYKSLRVHREVGESFFIPENGDEVMFWSAIVVINKKLPDNKVILVGED